MMSRLLVIWNTILLHVMMKIVENFERIIKQSQEVNLSIISPLISSFSVYSQNLFATVGVKVSCGVKHISLYLSRKEHRERKTIDDTTESFFLPKSR